MNIVMGRGRGKSYNKCDCEGYRRKSCCYASNYVADLLESIGLNGDTPPTKSRQDKEGRKQISDIGYKGVIKNSDD